VCERKTDAIIDGSACSDESTTSVRTQGPQGSAYYNDACTIENWAMGNEGETPEIYEPLIDQWDAQLNVGQKELRDSEAYKWLVHALKGNVDMKGVQAVHMEGHRKWLLDMLEANTPHEQASICRISRRRKPVLFTVALDLVWNLKRFLEHQEYAASDSHGILSRVIYTFRRWRISASTFLQKLHGKGLAIDRSRLYSVSRAAGRQTRPTSNM
jgi:hypothetical protein